MCARCTYSRLRRCPHAHRPPSIPTRARRRRCASRGGRAVATRDVERSGKHRAHRRHGTARTARRVRDLGIPLTAGDTGTHTLSNGGLKLQRVLGSAPLGRYIDCGSTPVGENADSYDVYLTVVSQVEEDPATGLAILRTIFDSMARPIAFSREYSRCSSRGELERRLAAAVMNQLLR